jgi:hypothetical protein
MAGGAFYGLKNVFEIEKKIAFQDRAQSLTEEKISKYSQFPTNELDEDQDVSFEQFLEGVLKHSAGYITGIRQGRFSHTQNAEKCRGWDGQICEYQSLCKLNTFKQAHLSKSPSKD